MTSRPAHTTALALCALLAGCIPAQANPTAACPPPPTCPPAGMALVPLPPPPADGEVDPAQQAMEALQRAESALGK